MEEESEGKRAPEATTKPGESEPVGSTSGEEAEVGVAQTPDRVTEVIAGLGLREKLGDERNTPKHEPSRVSEDEKKRSIFRMFRADALIAGQFHVVRLLGAGGMGEVFVARDNVLGRRVALKTLKLQKFADEAARTRFIQLFERDAASTAQLSHPGIVTIFQLGEHEGTPFFVLEFVDGQSLDRALASEGALEEREVLRLGVQLCEALSYAHSMGVVHRDIKPANLMRTRDGRLKVLDFGIALMNKAREELEEAFGSSHTELRTRLGEESVIAGTPGYMAPEQFRGLKQDARTDIWAVGVTLFELLTGRRPYPSQRQITRVLKLVWPEEYPVSEATMLAVQGCLTLAPGARTVSMKILGEQLAAALAALSPSDEASDRRPKRTNLTALEDAFVGRQGSLASLDARVFGGAQEDGHRLVTLVGPGGVGKTRLVTEWGLSAMEREDVQEVAFCSLTEARNKDSVLFAIGAALQVPLTQKDPVVQLGHVFGRKRGLVLILDNCEQVAQVVADLLGSWAASLTRVKVVATSRVGLDVQGERLLPLAPLGDMQEAAALYIARARQQQPEWTCPSDQQDALRELVEQLDGLPLAIELAAARVKVLGPHKMLARISQRFQVLKSRRLGANDRQSTLRGAITWSWELLDEAQQSAMAQMSIFEGSFSLEAAEEVVDLSHLEEESFVLDVVEGLSDASLLRSEGDEERFKMLVSVRAFSQEQLSSSGAEYATRARHARWFARWSFDDVLRERGLGLPRIAQEVADLEAASKWGLAPGRSAEEREWGMVCTAVLAASRTLLGPYHEGNALVARVRGARHGVSEGMARALGRLGLLAFLEGQPDLSRELCTQALDTARQLGDPRLEGVCLGTLGILEQANGRVEQAKQLFEQSLGIARQLGDPRLEGVWLGNLGILEQANGRVEQAKQLFEQSLGIARQVSDLRSEGISLGKLAILKQEQGEGAQAKQLFAQALRIVRQLGDLRSEGICLGNLGRLEREQGSLEQAKRLLDRALDIAREVSDLRMEGVWLSNLGSLELERGRVEQAKQLFEQSLGIARQVKNTRGEVHCRVGLGRCDAAQGDQGGARANLEACFALLAILKRTRSTEEASSVLELASMLGVEVPAGTFVD